MLLRPSRMRTLTPTLIITLQKHTKKQVLKCPFKSKPEENKDKEHLHYGGTVDSWAVGVLTYEMRCGHSPFEAKSQMEMFKKITKRDFKFPRCGAAMLLRLAHLRAATSTTTSRSSLAACCRSI